MIEKIFTSIGKFVVSQSKWVAGLSILLAVIALITSILFLKFDTNQDNLVSNSLAYHQRYMKFIENFSDNESIYLVFEVNNNLKQVKEAIKDTVGFVKNNPSLYESIEYRINPSFLLSQGLTFLKDEDFKDFSKTLLENQHSLSSLWQVYSLASYYQFITHQINTAAKGNTEGISFWHQWFDWTALTIKGLHKKSNFTFSQLSAPIQLDSNYVDLDGYLLTPNGKYVIVQIMPIKDYSKMDIIEQPLKDIREHVKKLQKKWSDLTIGITGRPVLQSDEMNSTGSDSVIAGILAFLGVAFVFYIFYGSGTRPLLSMSALACGLCWTLGWITLTLGHLNLLSIVFTIILIGLGIDYGVHYLFRFQNFLDEDFRIDEALIKALASAGFPIFLGALSSAVAFFTAMFTDFLGLKELGFIAGSGLLFCLISQIITLPAFLSLIYRQKDTFKQKSISFNFLKSGYKNPKRALAFILLLSLSLLPFFFKVKFENNLLKLQDPKLESVQYELKLLEDSGHPTWFASLMTPDLDTLQNLQEKMNNLPSVSKTESILNYLPIDMKRRILEITRLRSEISLPENPTPTQSNINDIFLSLKDMQYALEEVSDKALQAGRIDDLTQIENLNTDIEKAINTLSQGDYSNLLHVESIFMTHLYRLKEKFQLLLHPQFITQEDLPHSILERYKGKNNQYALYIYPKENIWEPKHMKLFISELRSIYPHITGSPIQVYESARRMKKGFYIVGILTIIIVVFMLWFSLRSLADMLLAMIPLLIGGLWLIELMGIMHLDISLGNFFALPILIGIGIDNGIHIIHRYREEGNLFTALHSVGSPIILSTLTTLIGFGALSFVRHNGLASFGQIMSWGSLACLVASLLLIPLIIQIKGKVLHENK